MEAIGRLAGGMAHALNNLMTTALGYSEIMLGSMKPGAPYFTNMQEIKRSATRTMTLTQKLLAFSRKQILALYPVDLNVLVSRLAPAIRLLHPGVRLDLVLEPALGVTRVEPNQLEQSISTLARNACDAMPDGRTVTIQTANVELDQDYTRLHPEIQPGPYVVLAVSDAGTGMDPEAISNLFEPFYTNDSAVGAGLGLAAAYGFVKQCDGDIDVRSRLEIGTTFRIFLPRNGSEAGKP